MSRMPVFGVSDFVAVFNQTVAYAYPSVVIEGELSSFRVSKNRWVYFDLKDEDANVRFFGSVYNLPGPLEDGMMLRVVGSPQLHPKFGFSITVQSIQLAGEGTIKKAAKLLEAKLSKEGLFEQARKRMLPYPPKFIGLITSGESAAYADFVKVIGSRWSGLEIGLYDVQVQGEDAPTQIIAALEYFNSHAQAPDVLVITRGGGSSDDLQAFNTESITRAVAGSRIPTLVAIGHEIDVSLAEMAADMRASTPSNAAELLVPDRQRELAELHDVSQRMSDSVQRAIARAREKLSAFDEQSRDYINLVLRRQRVQLEGTRKLLSVINPSTVLKRGYALVYKDGTLVRSKTTTKQGDQLQIRVADGELSAEVK